MASAYFDSHWPADTMRRLINALDPSATAELSLDKGGDLPPLRNQQPRNIAALARSHRPANGFHIGLSAQNASTLVLDVDLDPTALAVRCTCRDERRSICDACWVTMAGVLRGYEYMLRKHFCCSELLACFSGGRGWHLFVLDADNIEHRNALQVLARLVPETVRRVAEIVAQTPALLHLLSDFDPTPQPSATTNRAGLIDACVLSNYSRVLLPFFQTEWTTRVIGGATTPEAAAAIVGAHLEAAHPAGHSHNCRLCPVARAYSVAYSRILALAPSQRPPFDERIDVFLAVATLLWQAPDGNVTSSARHLIRLPLSPHARSGRFSLPMEIDRAHELRPMTCPPLLRDVGTPNTFGHARFQQALDVLDILLEQHERTPRLAVWPT